MHYVTDDELDAILTERAKINAAKSRVSRLKKRWSEGKGANMTLAEKLAALRKAADGKIAI